MKRVFLLFLIGSTVALLGASFVWPKLLYVFIVLGPILVIGAYDLIQRRHTILRNYPIIGHMRYVLEDARHHIRQYLIQGDQEGDPFTRPQRSVVYQRAKNVSDVQPFGTLFDVNQPGYEWFEHSVAPFEPSEKETRVRVGSKQCNAPYESSHLNISAMSFGSLSGRAVLALNGGARLGGFAHNTGEGGISRFHREPGGDLIWQLGTGYFGCRAEDGSFDAGQFKEKSRADNVRMIEIKLSQGAKPGGGGLLPAAKVTAEIAKARGVPQKQDVASPAAHRSFSTPIELMSFVAQLRELCAGKPVGLKLCLGRRDQFMAIVKAMVETGIVPDFVTVDGSEGGTGAAPRELTDRVGVPLREGLVFVHNALVGADLRDQVRVICSGKVINGYDMAAKIAMGADICNSARGMMFALGCIQSRRCHANTCPTGIASQDKWRVSGLVVADKTQRVASYHHNTIKHFLKLMAACGVAKAGDLTPNMLWRRVEQHQSEHYATLFDYLQPGALLDGSASEQYLEPWSRARAKAFS